MAVSPEMARNKTAKGHFKDMIGVGSLQPRAVSQVTAWKQQKNAPGPREMFGVK